MNNNDKRLFLRDFIKSESAIDELIIYTENKFIHTNKNRLPLNNEYIKTWEAYDRESQKIGAFTTLKKYLVQLQYPIQKGISKTEDYINATRKGKQKLNTAILKLNAPERIQLEIYESAMVGKVPVIVVPDDDDFNTVICALSNKNEPKELPDSMGALFINGINNWDRINRLKSNWLKNNPLGNWNEEFKKNIFPKPHLYKDKLIVLSTKDYSGVKSAQIGVSKSTWKSSSLVIRKEHECTHLFTLQYYGYMANNIHDEIIADYAGITNVLGQFNKEWFLQFMGLEEFPNYRKGGRLQNYQAPIELSKDAFDGLKTVTKKVTESIFGFDTILGKITTAKGRLDRIKSICEVDMITMASSKGVERLLERYHSKKTATVL